MRLSALIVFAAICVSLPGCEKDQPISDPMAQKPTFPEPKASPERTEFLKIANLKKEIDNKRKNLALDQKNEQTELLAKHPIGVRQQVEPGDPPPPPPTPEQRENRRLFGELRSKQAKFETDLNIEYLKFMESEYYPAVLKYAEFCHKTFLAEPNKANGGALYELADILYQNGNLDEAYRYSSDLVKNGFESAEIYDLAAASAYCTDHFDEGFEYFERAQRQGPCLRTTLVAVRSDFDESIKAWSVEKEIRAKEAAADDLPRVKLETEVGTLIYELFENEAPETVGNFISLVESGYYDNTTFYSVVLTAAIYHGQKSRNDDLGYTIRSEANNPNRRFPFRGAITMNASDKNGGASIYGISLRSSPYLFGTYTTFGRIIEGFDVLPKIAKFNARTPMSGMQKTKILKATVVRKRDHEYKPTKIEPAAAAN